MSRPLKLLLLGYYGFGNAGDELILETIQQQLSSLQHPFELTVIASERPLSLQPSTELVFRRDRLKILRALARCDVFVLGGGGLIQDKTSLASLFYYLGFVWMARVLRKPVLLWSIGVETLTHPLGRALTRLILSGTRIDLRVRDEESREFLAALGLKEKVSLSADPVFLTTDLKSTGESSTKRLLVIPRVGGTLSNLNWKELSLRCRRELGLEPMLLLMHPQHDIPLELLTGPDMPFLLWNDLEELKEYFRQASCVLSERLHGVILSAVAGIPFSGVGPMEKTGRFCSKTQAPWRSAISQNDELIRLLKETVESKTLILKNVSQIMPELRARAGAQVRALLPFFNL